MRVAKWGNSLAVRLPAAIVEALDLKEGDDVQINLTDAKSMTVERKASREDLIARLEKYRGRLPADYKFSRDEANER